MYSLIIAEDNDDIRSGLVHLFPWEETGFSIAGDFANGLTAWNYLKDHPQTNVVLSDIRMPVLDGLELSRLISENYPDINIVLISGYQDFSYAQQAIRYNVKDFLIKPLKHAVLSLSLLKIKEELDKHHAPSEEEIQSNQYYEEIIRIVKSYISENLRSATLEEAASIVHLSSGYLSRLFKNRTNKSFSDYLLSKRMEKACVLLRNIQYKIYEISDATGYDNPKNFTRTFKNYYNMSPKEFREKGSHIA